MSPARLTKAELGLEAELVVDMTLPLVVRVWWLPSGPPVPGRGGMGGTPLPPDGGQPGGGQLEPIGGSADPGVPHPEL